MGLWLKLYFYYNGPSIQSMSDGVNIVGFYFTTNRQVMIVSDNEL